MEAVSNRAIAFHYIEPKWMYMYEYLLYQLEPVGERLPSDGLPAKLTFDQMVAQFEQSEQDKNTLDDIFTLPNFPLEASDDAKR